MYITLVTFHQLHGDEPLKVDGIVKLVKEPENRSDAESIACEMKGFGKIGYVANDASKVIRGSVSAGRLYDKINDEYFARIKFICDAGAIAKILTPSEFEDEIKNPESDVYQLSDNVNKELKVKKNTFKKQ